MDNLNIKPEGQAREGTNSCYECQYRLENDACKQGQNSSKPCKLGKKLSSKADEIVWAKQRMDLT